MTRVLSGLQSSCLRNRCLDRSSGLRNRPWNEAHAHRRGHHHSSTHGKSPSCTQFGSSANNQHAKMSSLNRTNGDSQRSHSLQLKTIRKTICLTANIYILQELKLNKEHWEKSQVSTPKSLVNNKQRKFTKIWLTNRPLFYGAKVSSALNASYLSTWTTERLQLFFQSH